VIRDEEAVAEFIKRGLGGRQRRQWPDEDGILVGGPHPRPKERTAKKLQKAVRSYSKSAAIEPF
jgi:hypothetical protein